MDYICILFVDFLVEKNVINLSKKKKKWSTFFCKFNNQKSLKNGIVTCVEYYLLNVECCYNGCKKSICIVYSFN